MFILAFFEIIKSENLTLPWENNKLTNWLIYTMYSAVNMNELDQFYWNVATSMCLHVVYGCFLPTMNSCDRYCNGQQSQKFLPSDLLQTVC